MKNVSRLLTVILITMSSSFLVKGQEDELNKKMSIGGQLGQYQNDFGIGLNVTSPYFSSASMALRFRGNLMFHQHLDQSKTVWSSYSNFSLGLLTTAGEMGGFVCTYAEGGAKSDLSPGEPIYSNGLIIETGFRFYLGGT